MKKRVKRRLRAAISTVEERVSRDESMSLATRDAIEDLMDLVIGVLDAFLVTSDTSSQPPSKDSQETKTAKRKAKGEKESKKKKGKKPGGQQGHPGAHLGLSDNPDKMIPLVIDRRTIPADEYEQLAVERRQVVDFEVTKIITEYQAERVRSLSTNERYCAAFPETVTAPVQYGAGLKSHALYLTTKQLIPYERAALHFEKEFGIPVSTGSLVNWERELEAHIRETFLPGAVNELVRSDVLALDETSVSVAGDLHWAHEATNGKVFLFFAHKKRGKMAMDDIGILPAFSGVMLHDHWTPYFRYKQCSHALCNAHHIRDLRNIGEDPAQAWANELISLLEQMNSRRKSTKTGKLTRKTKEAFEARYDSLVQKGLRLNPGTKKKGKKRTKARCLLDRLRDFKPQVLAFLHNPAVSFTNNDAERPMRMLKVEMKISGTYKSLKTANRSLLIRSYLLTCQNHGISAGDAIKMAFKKEKLPFLSQAP